MLQIRNIKPFRKSIYIKIVNIIPPEILYISNLTFIFQGLDRTGPETQNEILVRPGAQYDASMLDWDQTG